MPGFPQRFGAVGRAWCRYWKWRLPASCCEAGRFRNAEAFLTDLE